MVAEKLEEYFTFEEIAFGRFMDYREITGANKDTTKALIDKFKDQLGGYSFHGEYIYYNEDVHMNIVKLVDEFVEVLSNGV